MRFQEVALGGAYHCDTGFRFRIREGQRLLLANYKTLG